jgi:hypothetical protein
MGVPCSLIYTLQVASSRSLLVIVLPFSPSFRANHFLVATNNSLISQIITSLPLTTFMLQPLYYLNNFSLQPL